jgi:Zn-dependent protease
MSISGALGLLNMVPMFYLDGEHACTAFLKVLLPAMSEDQRQKISRVIFWASSVLLAITLLVSLFALM